MCISTPTLEFRIWILNLILLDAADAKNGKTSLNISSLASNMHILENNCRTAKNYWCILTASVSVSSL